MGQQNVQAEEVYLCWRPRRNRAKTREETVLFFPAGSKAILIRYQDIFSDEIKFKLQLTVSGYNFFLHNYLQQ